MRDRRRREYEGVLFACARFIGGDVNQVSRFKFQVSGFKLQSPKEARRLMRRDERAIDAELKKWGTEEQASLRSGPGQSCGPRNILLAFFGLSVQCQPWGGLGICGPFLLAC